LTGVSALKLSFVSCDKLSTIQICLINEYKTTRETEKENLIF